MTSDLTAANSLVLFQECRIGNDTSTFRHTIHALRHFLNQNPGLQSVEGHALEALEDLKFRCLTPVSGS